MKIKFNENELKQYFEAFDKEMLKKIYDQAASLEQSKKALDKK